MKYRKKPVEIEATQWFKNGDHPLDHHILGQLDAGAKANDWEGRVVRRYRNPQDMGDRLCKHCDHIMHNHGWIDTLEGGHIVCPGDFVITGVMGETYPCKPYIFAQTYEAIE